MGRLSNAIKKIKESVKKIPSSPKAKLLAAELLSPKEVRRRAMLKHKARLKRRKRRKRRSKSVSKRLRKMLYS